MVNLKTGIKVTLISAALIAGSATSTARADHDSHSILPYVAIGIFASILNNHSHSHHYRYKKERIHRHSGHGHGHGHGHYSSYSRHNHNHGGYRYKRKKH